MKTLSLAQARRMALAAQGFGDPRPSSVGVRQFRRALERMTILQLDSVNVLCRSHFLPFFARLGAYDRDKLDEFIWRSGENLEFLAHEASVTKVNHFSLLRDRMTIERWKSGKRFRDENAEYLKAVVAEIKKNGPMSVKDLKDAGPRAGPWWGWSKGKVALEVLYRSGRLAIAYRTKSFLTHYDLVERVVSKEVRSRKISDAEAQKEKLVLAAKSHGIGSDKDLADYFRMKVSLCRPLLEALADEGRLKRVQVEGFESVAYMHAKAKGPRACKARALLSPFDPVVWCRPRALRLFDFHYRIEIYVPQNKRSMATMFCLFYWAIKSWVVSM